MQPEVMITFLAGLFGIGAIILAGQWIRQRTLRAADSQTELHRLAESVEELREQVGALDRKMLTLDERLEFTERLLTKAQSPDAPPTRGQ